MKRAFLNGDLTELVYMLIPEGFNHHGSSKVCRLLKSLYGLKEAPRAWFEKVDEFLQSNGLTRTEADYSSYYHRDDGGVFLLIFYVDDLLLT